MPQAEAQSTIRGAGRGTVASNGKCSRTVSWALAFLVLVFVNAQLQLQMAHPCFGKDS